MMTPHIMSNEEKLSAKARHKFSDGFTTIPRGNKTFDGKQNIHDTVTHHDHGTTAATTSVDTPVKKKFYTKKHTETKQNKSREKKECIQECKQPGQHTCIYTAPHSSMENDDYLLKSSVGIHEAVRRRSVSRRKATRRRRWRIPHGIRII